MVYTKSEINRFIMLMDNTAIKLPSQTRAMLMITDDEFRYLYDNNKEFREKYNCVIKYQEAQFLGKIVENLSSTEFNHKQAQFILDKEFGWNTRNMSLIGSQLTEEEKQTIENANNIISKIQEKYERDY